MEFSKQSYDLLGSQTTKLPDISLLLGGNPTQFLELVEDTIGGEQLVRFLPAPRTTSYGPRWAVPGLMLVVRGCQLYGGGVNTNNNDKGRSYVRMGGDHKQNVQIGRILTDAEVGAIAVQGDERGFRIQHPGNFTATSSEVFRDVSRGRPRREPKAGREDAIKNALAYHAKNSAKTDIGLSAAEYEAFLRRCFAILDALHEAREAKLRPQAA